MVAIFLGRIAAFRSPKFVNPTRCHPEFSEKSPPGFNYVSRRSNISCHPSSQIEAHRSTIITILQNYVPCSDNFRSALFMWDGSNEEKILVVRQIFSNGLPLLESKIFRARVLEESAGFHLQADCLCVILIRKELASPSREFINKRRFALYHILYTCWLNKKSQIYTDNFCNFIVCMFFSWKNYKP